MKNITVSFKVNGTDFSVSTLPNRTLLELLRQDLGFTGVKDGCREGECGACTILFDGTPMNSCLVTAGQAEGHEVITIEGLSPNGELHPVQKAFIESGAIQCGFCSPGFILSTAALLQRNPDPSEFEIKEALAGNLCRCTGYTKIIEAVFSVAEEMKHG